MAIRCFWLESTHRARRILQATCMACGESTHVDLGEIDYDEGTQHPRLDWDAAPWPTRCEHCKREFRFDRDDYRSASSRPIYRRTDNGGLVTLREAPAGAMWDATWWTNKGDDGRSIVVRVPGDHDWAIDSRASNCGRRGDKTHHCWCRHGEPPDITVDKNCDTCPAGGGSFWANMPHGWHGMLTNGWLHLPGEPVPPAAPVASAPGMMGRRLPDRTWPEVLPDDVQEGDFWYVHGGPHDDPSHDRKGHWYVCTPGHHVGGIPHHKVEEHEDGLISVLPLAAEANSILIATTRDGQEVNLWHGFIHHGEWRSV